MRDERIDCDGIPARLYDPGGATGLVLLGHGGGSSKDDEQMVSVARAIADGAGLAVLAIDAIDHGERAPAGGAPFATRASVMPWIAAHTEQMVLDWKTAAAAVAEIAPPVAYVGFSMGMLLGAPTVAAMPELRAAVFGVGGVPSTLGEGDLVLQHAPSLGHVQLLMLNMTKDDTFGVAGVHAFFDAVPGRKKRLMFWEGGHTGLPSEAIRHAVTHLTRYAS